MIDYWLPYIIMSIAKIAGYLFLVVFCFDILGKATRWLAVSYCRTFYGTEENSQDDSADVTQEVDK